MPSPLGRNVVGRSWNYCVLDILRKTPDNESVSGRERDRTIKEVEAEVDSSRRVSVCGEIKVPILCALPAQDSFPHN